MHEKISPPTVPLGRDQSIFETHSERASHRLVCCKSFPSDSDMSHWKAWLSTPLRTAELPVNMRHFENMPTRGCLLSWEYSEDCGALSARVSAPHSRCRCAQASDTRDCSPRGPLQAGLPRRADRRLVPSPSLLELQTQDPSLCGGLDCSVRGRRRARSL